MLPPLLVLLLCRLQASCQVLLAECVCRTIVHCGGKATRALLASCKCITAH